MVLTRLKKGSRESYAAKGRLGSGIGLLAVLGSCVVVSNGLRVEVLDRGASAGLCYDTRAATAAMVRNHSACSCCVLDRSLAL
jgi:hypothetical protein